MSPVLQISGLLSSQGMSGNTMRRWRYCRDHRFFQSFPESAILPRCPLGAGRAESSAALLLMFVAFAAPEVHTRQPFCLFPVQGVLVPGPGLFAAVREQFHSKEVAVSVRRPVFQLDIGVLWLQDLQSPTDIIPGEKAAATFPFPPHVRPGVFSLLFGNGWEQQRIVCKARGAA